MLRGFFIGVLLSPLLLIALAVLGNHPWIFSVLIWGGGGLLLLMVVVGLWNWRPPPGRED